MNTDRTIPPTPTPDSRRADDDRRLRALFHSTLRGCPPDPLFTRKVLNRLPAPRRRRWVRAEYAVYLLALVLTLLYGAEYFTSVVESGGFSLTDILPALLFSSLLGGVLYCICEPFATASARPAGMSKKL